jgi:hypothetical protein
MRELVANAGSRCRAAAMLGWGSESGLGTFDYLAGQR